MVPVAVPRAPVLGVRRTSLFFCFLNNLSELRILTTFCLTKIDHRWVIYIFSKTITGTVLLPPGRSFFFLTRRAREAIGGIFQSPLEGAPARPVLSKKEKRRKETALEVEPLPTARSGLAVVARVERFDRRGTEQFEPFEPFEFFQNRNFH